MSSTFRARRLTRRLSRPLTRRLTRRIGRGPQVNHLGQALRAFGRAVRAHRRLIQLAPAVFDEAVVRRETAERLEWERVGREVAVALDKVYGSAPPELHRSQVENWCRNGAETVRFSRRKTLVIEQQLAELGLWLAAGRVAFDRHQHLRPHRRLSLGTAVRLVEVATQFGRLACGLPCPGKLKLPDSL